jgi:hypothetical protein
MAHLKTPQKEAESQTPARDDNLQSRHAASLFNLHFWQKLQNIQ